MSSGTQTKKKKIGFLIHNKGIQNIDIRCVEMFNPGIGGTEYQFFLLIKKLNDLYNKELEIHVYLDAIDKRNLFNGPIYHLSNEMKDNQIVDLLIVKDMDYDSISQLRVKKIVICHNQPSRRFVKTISVDPLSKIVFLTKSEAKPYLNIIRILFKMSICPNLVTTDFHFSKNPHDKFILAFIGAIKPAKSFDVVAKIWPEIVKLIPNSELWVFGSGSLYDRNRILGKNGIADGDYEKEIFSSINDSISKTIKWFGNVSGDALYKQLQNVDLGIVNPRGNGETFCLSIFDFMKCGIPILLNNKVGVYREVASKCGFYYDSFDDIPFISKNYYYGNVRRIDMNTFRRQVLKYDYKNTIKRFYRIIRKNF